MTQVKDTEEMPTGLRLGGDRICNNGEIESSTEDFIDRCLEICGDILLCQDLKISIFSINIFR